MVPVEDRDRDVFQRIRAGSGYRFEGEVSRRDGRRGHAHQLHLQQVPAGQAGRGAPALRPGRGDDSRTPGWKQGRWRNHPPGDGAHGNREGVAHPACAAGHHRHELPGDRLRRSQAQPGAADILGARPRVHPEHAVDIHAILLRRRRCGRKAAAPRSRRRSDASRSPARNDERARGRGRHGEDIRIDQERAGKVRSQAGSA